MGVFLVIGLKVGVAYVVGDSLGAKLSTAGGFGGSDTLRVGAKVATGLVTYVLLSIVV